MIDPSVSIQNGVFAALRADAPLIALFQGLNGEGSRPADKPRVFDRVPDPKTPKFGFPYITIPADDQVLDDSDQCHDGAETFVNLHIWSRAVGQIEAKAIAAAVARCLNSEIAVEGHRVVSAAIEKIIPGPSGDGLTTHRIVTVRYLTEPLAGV